MKQRNDATEKAKALDNSRPANLHLWSKHRSVKALVDRVYQEIKGLKLKKRYSEKKEKRSLKAVLLNLYTAHRVDPSMYVAVSKRSGDYSKGRYIAYGFGYRGFRSVIEALVDSRLSYLEVEGGYIDWNKGKGRSTRVRATEKLVALFDEAKLSRYMVSRVPEEEVIRLKDENKKLIDYKSRRAIDKMKKKLRMINESLSQQWIDLHVTDQQFKEITAILKRDEDRAPIDFTKTTLKRVFNNGSFEQGGRFYHGWWHGVPGKYRKFIQIRGKETVEVDYSAMHLSMLYAQEGLPLIDGEAYDVDGIDSAYRKSIKRAFNTMLNANSEKQAKQSISRNIELPDGMTAADLMAAIKKKHKPIAHYFNTGEGLRLQYKDSRIAERVLMKLYRKGILCLTVHDSFIVPSEAEEHLKSAMGQAFKKVIGVPAKFDVKTKASEWEARERDGIKEWLEEPDREFREYKGYWERYHEFEMAHGRGTATEPHTRSPRTLSPLVNTVIGIHPSRGGSGRTTETIEATQ